MPVPIHVSLTPADCHPPKAVTFTGDPAAYVPAVAGVLVLKTDVTPNQLYRTTGTTAGAVTAIGGVAPVEFVRDSNSPQSPPLYDGIAGISFYIHAYSEYGSPAVAFYIGVDTTGTDFTNGWQQVQNF